MVNKIYKKFFSENIIQLQINFLFVSFIFLSGLKYDYLQLRFLILILLIPCGLKIIDECIYKNFKNTIFFFFLLIILLSHSFLNIYFENVNITKYNLFGIFLLTCIFIISFYFYENFNRNILNLVKLFLLLFFSSVLLSFLNFKNDAPFFCGGIPDIFGLLKSYETYLPNGSIKVLNYLELDRIGDMKFSFKEYLFPENSHLGMIAPSVLIYLIHINFTTNDSKFFKIITYLFILICLVKSSTTLVVGTILSLIILMSFNYKSIPKKTLIAFSCVLIIFTITLISSKECRSRFVPIYLPNDGGGIIGEVDKNVASKLENIMGIEGNLSAGVYFRALMIAKKSIIEKPFGWGLNRYDKAFEYFNKVNPSKVKSLNSYNNKDGTNNFVKMIVELGVFAIIVYLFIFLFLVSKKIPIEYKLFYLPFVITQSLRGAGYFNGGFSLIVFFMLFTYLKLNNKKL